MSDSLDDALADLTERAKSAREADGGPAFHCNFKPVWDSGMTLRDWFAGQALAGIDWQMWFSECPTALESSVVHEDLARCAYATADAMLAERRKGQRGG